MNLQTLLRDMEAVEVRGDTDIPVTGVAYDSREVSPGNVFVCLEGLTVDGHRFAPATVERGAAALVVQRWLSAPITQVKVSDSRAALARLSTAFFRHPSLDVVVLGVTGTNGKTTVTHLLRGIGRAAGCATEVVGTLGTTGFTTPESPRLQQTLREAADGEADWVAMECSSHALAQKRLLGTRFDVVVFTNLSRDHLDYHHTMEAYFQTKARLFGEDYRKEGGVAVLPTDEPYGRRLWEETPGAKVSYGFSEGAQVRARDVRLEPEGGTYRLSTGGAEHEVRLHLPGRYNVLNALAAQAAGLQLGLSLETVSRGVETVASIPGRMETVPGPHPFHVYVDYAHTPDGLQLALEALREVTSGRLWVVFGCGGDRDAGKRPLMGGVAERLADCVVVTSDNPRSEDPQAIVDEVLAGFQNPRAAHVDVDRRAAIRWVLYRAEPGDTVLIAGKGHEARQLFKDTAVDFDDRTVAAAILEERHDGGR